MKSLRLGSVALVSCLALTGCSAFSDNSSADTSDGVQVVASFYPLQFVASAVAGEHATVEVLTAPGQEPHDLEPSVKETGLISSADLVLFEQGLQPGIDAAIDTNAGGEVLEAGEVVGLQPFAEADHADEAEGNEEDGAHHEDDGHDHEGGLDPHFWLDPARMAELADAVAESLADLDPDHADDYRANAASLRTELTALDEDFTAGLAQCELHTIVVSHDAFGYYGKYGIEVAPIAGLSPDAEPTPADLAALLDVIEHDGITTVFGERLAPPQLTETLAQDAGVTTAVLDPIEGLTDETSDATYVSLMRDNLAALREANQCA